MTEDVYKNLVKRSSRSKKNFMSLEAVMKRMEHYLERSEAVEVDIEKLE